MKWKVFSNIDGRGSARATTRSYIPEVRALETHCCEHHNMYTDIYIFFFSFYSVAYRLRMERCNKFYITVADYYQINTSMSHVTSVEDESVFREIMYLI
jgi:hypothetical protein